MTGPKFITKIVQLSLYSMGILKNQQLGLAYSITITTAMALSTLGSVIGFLTRHGTAERLEALSAITPQLATLVIFVNLFTSRGNLLALLHKMKGAEEHTDKVISATEVIIKKKLIRFLILLCVLSICFITPTIFVSFHETKITEKNSFAIPFWYSCGNRKINSILMSLCWDVNSKKELFLANILLGTVLGCFYLLNCTAFCLYSVIVGELMMHVECLRNEVNVFINRTDDLDFLSYYGNRKIQRDQRMYEEFVKIVKYQQFIRSCALLTVETWKKFVTVFNLNFYFALTILLFMTFMEHDDAKLLAIRVSVLCVFGLIIATACSYYAQFISTINEDLFDEIVKIPWYHHNIKFRKIYAIVLTLNRRSIRVKIANMYDLNLNTFGSLLKTVYSLLNMLILKYGK